MPTVHRPSPELPEHLRALAARFPVERSLGQDPLAGVRPFAANPRAAEVGGIVAATLAVGHTAAIRSAFARFLERIGGDPAAWVDGAATDPVVRGPAFQHRWIRADQIDHLGRQLRGIYGRYGSLEEVYLEGRGATGGFADGLDGLARALRGDPARAPPGYVRLFPSPRDPGHSPCKRLALFVRWMVRSEYPDLGLWRRVSPSELCIPLDQHVYWIAYHLGLTRRRSRSWSAVEEVTGALRRIDPNDPVRYDFVLCHTGISGDCPKSRDIARCAPCAVRPDCALWRRSRRAS